MPADPTYEPGRPASRSRVARRQGQARARYKPPAPTPAPKLVQRSARTQTPQQRVAARKRARAVIRHGGRVIQPSSRQPAAPAPDDILGTLAANARVRPGQVVPERQTSGLEGLEMLRGSPQNAFGRILGNTGRGLLDIATGAPAIAQLGVENVAAFNPVAGALYAQHRLGGPSIPGLTGYQERVAGIDVEAAKGVAADYAYRYGPFFEGNWREGGRRVEDDPVPYALDIAAGKAAVARAPTGALRAARTISRPGPRRARLDRRLSGQSADVRLEYARRLGLSDEDLAVGNFLPGPGGLHRPPQRVQAAPVEPEGGVPGIPPTVREIPRRPYSRDVANRALQKAADRRRARQGLQTRKEQRAQARLPLPLQPAQGIGQKARVAREVVRPATAQGKDVRYIKGATLTLKDLYEAKSESVFQKTSAGAVHAINKLRGTTGPAGIAIRGRTTAREVAQGRSAAARSVLSVEEAAARLHLDDVLPDPGKLRGGKSAPQIRDLWVRGVEGRQLVARKADKRTVMARQQLQAVKEIPDDLLYLTGSSPAVKRVRAAVEEGRKLDAESQARSVAAKVVTAETAAEAATRPSAMTVGGARWHKEAVRASFGKRTRKTRQGVRTPTTRYEARLRAIDKRIAQAAPRSPERAALRTQRATIVRAQKGRRAYIRQQAVRETPALRAQRTRVEVAKARAKRAEAARKHEKPRARIAGGAVASPAAVRVPRPKLSVRLLPAAKGRKRGGWSVIEGETTPGKWVDLNRVISQHDTQDQALRAANRIAAERQQAPRAPARVVPELRARPRPEPRPAPAALRQALDRHVANLKRMEDEARSFTPPRRPELVGTRGVYIPARPVDPTRVGGARYARGGRFSGPDVSKRERGVLRAAARNDMNPALLVHQARRSAKNYAGTISRPALRELIDTAVYWGKPDKNGKREWLTADKVTGEQMVDPSRVRWLHLGNLKKGLGDEGLPRKLRELDELPEGKWIEEKDLKSVIVEDIDSIPAGVPKSHYVAISKDAADVWTQAMTSDSMFVRGLDKALNWWKGGLLALSPRWYVNNTFGLALQYLLLTGGDFKSVFQANRMFGRPFSKGRQARPIRKGITQRSPAAVSDTLADDLVGGATLPKMMTAGFKFNNRLEEFWRRAAYLNRAKKELRAEGMRMGVKLTRRGRDLRDAEVARAIENMPEPMATAIVRDLDFFIGNYRKFNAFERNVMKRVLPFYSWLRTIARLTFVLPIRSPTRLAIANVLANAQEAGLNPLDPALDYFERGALSGPGGLKIPTWSLNPWQSLAGLIAAVGDENPFGAALQDTLGWTHPVFQAVYSGASGESQFGTGLTTPPGTKPFGTEGPLGFNPVSQSISRSKIRLGAVELALGTLAPGQVSVLRRFWSEGRTPYGTTTTPELFQDWWTRQTGGKGNDKLYLDKGGARGREPVSLNRVAAAFGTPVYRQDDAKVRADWAKEQRKLTKEKRELAGSARRG